MQNYFLHYTPVCYILDGMNESRGNFEGGGPSVEFGPKNTRPVSLELINEIEQIRKSYPADKIDDLASSIEQVDIDTGEVSFDLYNPLLAAHLTAEQTADYLRDHREFYGEEAETLIEDLTPQPDQTYVVLVAGHRRKRAIEQLSHQYNLGSPEVRVNLRSGMSFEEGLVAQIRENTYEKIAPEETAKNIEQYYRYLQNSDPSKKPKISTLSAKTGLSESTVRSGLKFMRLPEPIRDIMSEYPGTISYSVLVQMEPLMTAYENYHQVHQISEDKEEYVVHSLISMVHTILNARLTTQDHYAKMIKGKIESINAAASFDQGTFFELEHETSQEVRRRTGAALITTSARALALALKTTSDSELSPENKRLLEELYQYLVPSPELF